MGRRRSEMNFTATFLALMVLAGCGSAPTEPTPAQGVTIFARTSYDGPSQLLLEDVVDLKRLRDGPQPDGDECAPKLLGPEQWTDCVSSIRVAAGWQATVYAHDSFRGDSLIVTSDIPDLRQIMSQGCPLSGWDDCISSMRVNRQ